jgi:RNA polymerase sigma-70 factor (sigma-E family)
MTTGAEGVRGETRADAIAELYARHSGPAFRIAYLLTGNADEAEDLVQDAFVKLMGRFADLRSPESFDAYLRRTLVNLSYGSFRRRRVERAYLARTRALTTVSADGIPDVEARDVLWSQLLNIAPRQRAALVLRYYDDLTEQQAAEVLGCSVRTVKSLVSRGMQAMRSQQGGELP